MILWFDTVSRIEYFVHEALGVSLDSTEAGIKHGLYQDNEIPVRIEVEVAPAWFENEEAVLEQAYQADLPPLNDHPYDQPILP